MAERNGHIEDFLAAAGWPGAAHAPLAADASFRRYERVRDGDRRAVLMDAPPEKEDVHAFARIARHLVGLEFSAPEVLAEDAERGFLLLEDLGDDTFTRLLERGESEAELYALAVDTLAALHNLAPEITAPEDFPVYDEAKFLEEASWLVDWHLPAVTGAETPAKVREAYLDCWRDALAPVFVQPRTLVLRDYHVDNLMRLSGREGIQACGLLDIQDAVAGPAAYDLVSLLEDARRDIDDSLSAAMRERYFDARADMSQNDREAFMTAYAVLGAQRHAKVIGVFTRLSRRDGKDAYLGHIPRVWGLLDRALGLPALRPVREWFDVHMPPETRKPPR